MAYRIATLDKGRIRLKFNYDPILISRIKSDVLGRTWNHEHKCWTAPLTKENIGAVRALGFILDENLKQEQRMEVGDFTDKIKLPKGLFPFQQEGVKQMERFGGKTLLADDPGLGKTIQALAWLYIHPELRPAIVVSPAKAKLNWAKHTKIWLPGEDVVVIQGTQTEEDVIRLVKGHPRAIILVNYEPLILCTSEDKGRTLAEALHYEVVPKALIVDECHYIANTKALRTKATKRLMKGRGHPAILALSGTPATSRPSQYFSVLNMLRPDLFPSFWKFAMEYCAPRHNGFGWDFSGASNTKKLHNILVSTCMVRRTKAEVLPDLPDKLKDVIPMEFDSSDYKIAEEDFISWLIKKGEKEKAERASRAEALTKMEGLKLLAAKGKLESVKGWIEDFLEGSQEKLVVFTQHIEIRDSIYNHFVEKVKAVKATGGNQSFKAAEIFQSQPDVRLFISNIDAAGDSIDLYAASNVAFVELPWTPGKLVQAEDRTHRIGQKQCVNIHYLVAEGTIDEELADILDKKNKALTAVADGKDVEEESLITELINKYKDKRRK